MQCNLARLQLAVKASINRSDDERRFQASIHGVKLKEPVLPVKTAREQVNRAKATFAGLGKRIVKVKR